MKQITDPWERFAYCFLILITIVLISWLTYWIFTPVRIKQYYLDGSSNGQVFKIGVIIDNAADQTIDLDRSVGLSEATRLIDSLNHTIQNK